MLYTDERIADVMIPVGCTDSASDAYDTAIMLCKQMRDSYEVALTALKSDARHAAQGTQRAEATIATQAAEIERLKQDNAELLHLRDMEHGRHQLARQEIEQMEFAIDLLQSDSGMIEVLERRGYIVISKRDIRGGVCRVCGQAQP